ncbi:MAG: phosphate regulon transcriptional regulator PhoB [Gammaproteobacteria bacterium]|nr:phosphate regulon transcriptional regulator PhoB [Gammaproteobacteria bacterium]
MSCILVVDDDPAIREMVGMALTREGYEMLEAGSAVEARQVITSRRPDLVLLDWMLPGQSGFEFARQLHNDNSRNPPPVIMLTARGQEADKIAALEAGADDYVSKPFSVSELLARIKAVLRRTAQHDDRVLLEIDGLKLDPGTRRVTTGGTPVELAPLEYRLLHFFMTHQERVYSRQQLIEQVWGTAYVEERTVDVHIRRLRKLLMPSGHDRLIQTVRSAGYRFSTHL